MKKSTGKRRAGGRGTLLVISGLLLASALIRVGNDAGQALARAADREESARSASGSEVETCETPEDLREMLTVLKTEKEKLRMRERALQDRARALEVANEEVNAKLQELAEAETSLRETIALAETAAEKDLDRLTKVYESMKPKQAAALFEEMDPSFAAGFLGRMRPEAAAAIMAGLSPGVAHAFSVVLAGRNADVPTQ